MINGNDSFRLPEIYPVACHTDHIGLGSTFVAIKGYKQDGAAYICQAIQQGARTVVIQHDAVLTEAMAACIKEHTVAVVRVDNTRRALATLSAAAWGHPAKKLRIIGITGTKGKTTSAFLLHHIMQQAGYKVALLSTVKNSIDHYSFKTNLTTQQPDYLHMFLGLCVNAGVEYVIMETAAQAFSLDRVHAIEFDGLLFTNFDQEHAEFYTTLQDYFQAKCAIFKQVKPAAPRIVNYDNAWCATIANPCERFGQDRNAAFYIAEHNGGDGTVHCRLDTRMGTYQFECPALMGMFNVYNVAGVVSLALSLGITAPVIAQGLHTFAGVPGRLERYTVPNGGLFIIDYAHNPSSYEQVLSTMRPLTEQLILVFGAGGERDRGKRPLMGGIAARYADHIILTSDNPRSEDPRTIIDDIRSGIADEYAHKVTVIVDRQQAIEHAYTVCKTGSITMLLGKGPDEYQHIHAIKYPFSEAAIIKSLR